MPVFEYRAVKPTGETVSGTLFSQSLTSAADSLAQQGLTVQHVGMAEATGNPVMTERPRTHEAPRASSFKVEIGDSVPLPDLSFFFRQLSTLLNAGVPMVQALYTLSSQTSSNNLRAAILEMRSHAEAGNPISEVIARRREIFSPLMLSMVRAGEVSGALDQTLREISHYTDREIELRNLYRRVTLYPKIVLVVSILVIFAANWIISAVAPGGERIEAPLNNPAILAAIIIIGAGIYLYLRFGLRNDTMKYSFDKWTLKVPGYGKTLKQLAMAKWGRAVGALYKAGVPIHDAVQYGAYSCGNEYLKEQMLPAIGRLKEGAGITETLAETGAFNPIVLDMTSTGERTGNLDMMLEKLSEYYELEAETKSHQLGVIAGVAILLVVAIYVGFVYITNMARIIGGGLSAAGAE